MNLNERLMLKCLNLAEQGGSQTLPNPLVGALLVKSGEIIGRGFHERYGEPHAEVNAIKDANNNVEGADLYVNLEPCSHYGKTPPCAQLIINSGIKNVYVGMEDPNPKVAGKGIKLMMRNGINVKVGILEKKCRELNEAFIKVITRQRSFITLKTAATLDGKIAEPNGYSKWITGEKSRRYVHKLRFLSDAIMVGGNTVRNDNPFLNVRDNKKVLNEPFKIIVTDKMNFSKQLNVFKKIDKVIFLTSENNEAQDERLRKIKRIFLPETEDGLLDFTNLDKILFENKVYNIFAEGGGMLNHSLLKYNLIDKLYIFFSNKIMGGNSSVNMFGGDTFFPLQKPFKVKIDTVEKIDDDLMIKAYPNGKY